MNLSDFKYYDVEESFGMGGPFLGRLELRGFELPHKYLADGEAISGDKNRVGFSRFDGIEKYGFLGLSSRRIFKILFYDEIRNSFFVSKDSFEALIIDRIDGDEIVFFEAFHKEYSKFKRTINFSSDTFFEIEPNNIRTADNSNKEQK